jgi:hypothetical protein
MSEYPNSGDEFEGADGDTGDLRKLMFDIVELRPKIIPSEIKFTSDDGLSIINYRYGCEITFDNSAYYKTEQLDWLIQCLQQLKEMTK